VERVVVTPEWREEPDLKQLAYERQRALRRMEALKHPGE
jgi:hypothetical protein